MSGWTFQHSGPFVIAGPCVLESLERGFQIADTLVAVAEKLQIPLCFKASFDKANRSGPHSGRGPGLQLGLEMLSKIREHSGLPVLTDVHEPSQLPLVAHDVAVTERGTFFGYHDLVVDYRNLERLRRLGSVKVIFDATHSVQRPGLAGDGASGGDRDFVPTLLAAAAVSGADGFFLETHPNPDQAISDAATQWPLDRVESLLDLGVDLWHQARNYSTGITQPASRGIH